MREKAPKTDEEWEEVRHHLFVLLEAPNLLVMEGREIARPEDHSRNPSVENEPEAVRKLVAADRPAFIRRARRLQDAAAVAMEAVDAKRTRTSYLRRSRGSTRLARVAICITGIRTTSGRSRRLARKGSRIRRLYFAGRFRPWASTGNL